MSKFWLFPKDLYRQFDEEFNFDFDPCPCPRPEGYNSLLVPWGKSNFVNPPFRRHDGVGGCGPTAFVRKAIAEAKEGKTSVLVLPVQSYVNLLLENGAELSSLGRVKWIPENQCQGHRQFANLYCAVSPHPRSNHGEGLKF